MPSSPLPDSSALEAGILEDVVPTPTRLGGLQEDVRGLLRMSMSGAGFGGGGGSVKGSPVREEWWPPAARNPVLGQHVVREDGLPHQSTVFNGQEERTPISAGIPQHQSTMFNARAVAALNHPDLSHLSTEQLVREKKGVKRRRKERSVGWTRARGTTKRRRRRGWGSRGVLCLFASLLLAALVASYVTIATSDANVTTTFHVLFVLGICLATIVFAHTVLRLLFSQRRGRDQRPLWVSVSRQGRHHHHHHHHREHHAHRPPHLREMPSLSTTTEPVAFVPPTPIPVHLSSDDVRLDPIEAQPSTAAAAAVARDGEGWDKVVESVPNPPPAYGRWRGSVRADPELLHWQPVPSPATPDTPALPSPTYAESVAAAQNWNESPPSYMTRESPARRAEVQEARAGIAHVQTVIAVEPEMVEVRSGRRTPNVGMAI